MTIKYTSKDYCPNTTDSWIKYLGSNIEYYCVINTR